MSIRDTVYLGKEVEYRESHHIHKLVTKFGQIARGGTAVYKDRKGAVELNGILEQVCKLIDKGLKLVRGKKFTSQDRFLYGYNMALVLGVYMLDIFEEIYYEHPDLIPPGAQPWPEGPPKRKRISSELSELERTAKTHYQVLQVDPRAETEVIQQAHRYLVAKYRKDNPITGNKELLDKVTSAWMALGDPKKRSQYDQSLTKGDT
jgi:hypothetical protein